MIKNGTDPLRVVQVAVTASAVHNSYWVLSNVYADPNFNPKHFVSLNYFGEMGFSSAQQAALSRCDTIFHLRTIEDVGKQYLIHEVFAV